MLCIGHACQTSQLQRVLQCELVHLKPESKFTLGSLWLSNFPPSTEQLLVIAAETFQMLISFACQTTQILTPFWGVGQVCAKLSVRHSGAALKVDVLTNSTQLGLGAGLNHAPFLQRGPPPVVLPPHLPNSPFPFLCPPCLFSSLTG